MKRQDNQPKIDGRRFLLDALGAVALGKGAAETHERFVYPRLYKRWATYDPDRFLSGRIPEMVRRYAPPGIKIFEDLPSAVRRNRPHYSVIGNQGRLYNLARAGIEEAAHEIGHAQIHSRLKGFYPAAARISRSVNDLTPFILGSGAYHYFRGKKEHPELAKKVRNASLGVTGLASLATLIDEAEASRRGLKMLKDMGLKKPEHARNLRKAWGSYAAYSAVPVAIAASIYGADALWDRWAKRKGSWKKQAKAKLKALLKLLADE